ncbi:MAG: GNAT family N-acetyltransferase [Verrucomicrobiota bacterium]
MALTIRSALATDAPAVGRLAKQFAVYLRTLGDQTEFKLTAEAYLRDGFGLRSAFTGLVAEEDGRVIGYLLYHFGYDSDGAFRNLHVVDLYVDAEARKKGVGKSLLTAAARIAREEGAAELIWSVYHANDLAAEFCERLGAQRITEVFFMKLPVEALGISPGG